MLTINSIIYGLQYLFLVSELYYSLCMGERVLLVPNIPLLPLALFFPLSVFSPSSCSISFFPLFSCVNAVEVAIVLILSCVCVLLLQEPNPEDPLNKEAAEVLQSNRRLFEQNVQRSLRGGYVGATYFERCLK